MGSKEMSFLKSIDLEISKDRIEKIFKSNPPCLICSLNVDIPGYLIEWYGYTYNG